MLEINQGLQEATGKFEKEKLTLMEQNKQLRTELDRVNSEKEQLMTGQKDQELELRELRQNKELLTQWERQIADIIQWVTEEKDARWVVGWGRGRGMVQEGVTSLCGMCIGRISNLWPRNWQRMLTTSSPVPTL